MTCLVYYVTTTKDIMSESLLYIILSIYCDIRSDRRSLEEYKQYGKSSLILILILLNNVIQTQIYDTFLWF